MIRTYTKGFSVIELITVIAIIGILSTIVIGATGASRARARDDRRISDMHQIQLALALYYDVNKTYPVGEGVSILQSTLVAQRYLSEIPRDPAGIDYEYIGVSSPLKKYCLGTKLEIASPPSDNDPGNCTSKSTGSLANYKVTR